VTYTVATGAYVVSKMVGLVWGESEDASPNATSGADANSQSNALAPLRNTQPIHLHPAIPSIGTTPILLGDFSKVEGFEFTATYPTPTLSSSDLLFMASVTLLQPRLSFPAQAATFFLSHLEGTQAALPTVVNPIPLQYAEAGQAFNFTFDLNHVFNDTDGDRMTFGGVILANGTALPSWVRAEPILLGSIDTPRYARWVTVQNGVALVGDWDSGLQIINVSTPSAPTFLGSYNTPGQAQGVTVQSGVAVVADGLTGLQIINVTFPSAPTLLGSYDTPGNAYGVTVQNGVAFVADGSSGLLVLDVSTPSAPTLLGSYNTPGFAWGVTVQNDVALVADDDSGLQIINVSTPSAPTLLGNYNTPGNAQGVTVQSGVALVADWTSGLLVLDVSTPSAPTLLGSYDTPGRARGVIVQSGVALVADDDSGLQVINVSTPSAPTLIGSYDTPGVAESVTVQNDVAFVADGTSGLQILDLGQTRFLGTLPATAMGPYNFTLSATNENGEWIATDFELRVGLAPTPPFSTTPSSVQGATSVSPTQPITGVSSQNPSSNSNPLGASDSATTRNPLPSDSIIPSSPTTPSTASGSETPPNANTPSPSSPDSNRFNPTAGNSQPSPPLIVISSQTLYLEVNIETTLTTDHLSVSGYMGDPSQLTYSIPPSDDYTVTVNGIEQYLFSQGDLGADFVSIRLEDSACFDYLNEIPVEVSDGTTTTDFTLIVVGDTASCANADASRLKNTESVVMLLVSSGLGMFAASRSAKEKVNRMWTEVIEADEKIAEEMDEVQNFGCVNA